MLLWDRGREEACGHSVVYATCLLSQYWEHFSLYSCLSVFRPILYHRRKQQIKIKESARISGNVKVRFYLRVENLFQKLKYVSNSMGKTVRVLVLAVSLNPAVFP